MHLTVVGGCQIFVFGLFYNVFHDFNVLEGPNGNIFCILRLFYECFAKIHVRVYGWLPMFENFVFYNMFLMISVNVDFILVL